MNYSTKIFISCKKFSHTAEMRMKLNYNIKRLSAHSICVQILEYTLETYKDYDIFYILVYICTFRKEYIQNTT